MRKSLPDKNPLILKFFRKRSKRSVTKIFTGIF